MIRWMLTKLEELFDLPSDSYWWTVYMFLWHIGQIILVVCWQAPEAVHTLVWENTNYRIVKCSSEIDGKHIKYDLLWPGKDKMFIFMELDSKTKEQANLRRETFISWLRRIYHVLRQNS